MLQKDGCISQISFLNTSSSFWPTGWVFSCTPTCSGRRKSVQKFGQSHPHGQIMQLYGMENLHQNGQGYNLHSIITTITNAILWIRSERCAQWHASPGLWCSTAGASGRTSPSSGTPCVLGGTTARTWSTRSFLGWLLPLPAWPHPNILNLSFQPFLVYFSHVPCHTNVLLLPFVFTLLYLWFSHNILV